MGGAKRKIDVTDKPVLEPLEPRLLYSADPLSAAVGGLLDPGANDSQDIAHWSTQSADFFAASDSLTRTSTSQPPSDIVFVNRDISNYQVLLDQVLSGSNSDKHTVVYAIDNQTDGVEFVKSTLLEHSDLTAVHFITHAQDAEFRLGTTLVDSESLKQLREDVAVWGDALSADGDLLFYGCNLAATDAGRSLMNTVSDITGADVSASDDLSGHQDFGADWDLEYSVGDIEAESVVTEIDAISWKSILAVIVADQFTDEIDAVNSSLSLREAILQANSNGTADEIVLLSGTYTLSLPGADDSGGDLDITEDLTIRGQGIGVTTIDAATIDRVLQVTGASTVTLQNLTITGGLTTDGGNPGGGIYVSNGALNLVSVSVEGNDSVVAKGGGIYVTATSSLNASESSFTNNEAGIPAVRTNGGAIYSEGSVTLDRVIVSFNYGNQGGAIHSHGDLALTDVSLFGNQAEGPGGAIYNHGGTLAMERVTLAGNSATDGGALATTSAATINNVTFANNSASDDGAAVHQENGVITITSSTFVNNIATGDGGAVSRASATDDITISSSVFAENRGNGVINDVDGTIVSDGFNIFKDGAFTQGNGTSDLVGIDPLLGALTDNGGFVQTFALLPGSPAINAGGQTTSTDVDATGSSLNEIPDIGAYEYRSSADETVLYWTDSANKAIYRGNPDSANPTDYQLLLETTLTPFDIELDLVNGKMYWLETDGVFGTTGGWGQIWLADLDGRNPLVFGAPIKYPTGLALDVDQDYMYVVHDSNIGILALPIENQIIRYGMSDGTSRLIASGLGGDPVPQEMTAPTDLEYDKTTNRLYWTDRGDGAGSGRTVNYVDLPAIGDPDGPMGTPVQFHGGPYAGVQAPTGLIVQPGGDEIYFATGQGITNVDASGVPTEQYSGDLGASDSIFGVEIDDANDVLYFSDTAGTIRTITSDFSSNSIQFSGLGDPFGIGIANLSQVSTTPYTNFAPEMTVAEGEPVVLDNTILGVSDLDSADADINYVVTSAPARGQIVDGLMNVLTTFTHAQVMAGDVFYQHLDGEDTEDTFSYTVADETNVSSDIALVVTVIPVNDEPTGADAAFTFDEGTSITLTAAHFGFSDVPENDSFSAVKITVLPLGGQLSFGGSAVLGGAPLTYTVAQLATNTLVYTPATNGAGTNYSSLKFQVVDDGGTDNGGQDTDQSENTLTFDITPINDEPAGTDDTLTIDEGGSLILTAAHFGFTDPLDGDALASIEITGVPSPGALTFAGAAITGVGPHTFTAAQLATNTLIYTPATNDNGAGYATLDFQVRDDGGTPNGGQDTDQSANTLTFDITSINDEPAGTDDTLTIDEGGSLILTAAHFGFTDPLDGDALASVEITGVPSPGALMFAGAAITGVGPHTFTVAQLATNTLIYTPATNDNGAGYATLDFQVHDDGGTPNGGIDTDATANRLTFDVTSINDEPAGTDNTLTIDEGGSLILTAAHFGFTDPLDGDALASIEITGVPAAGTLMFAGADITGVGPHTFTAAQLATNTLIYTPATNDNGTGYATLDFQVRDDGGTPNGGQDTDQSANTLTFDVTSINDEPAGTDDTLTIDEGGSLILTAAHFGFTDPLDGDALASVEITGVPSPGALTFAGAAITGVGPHTFTAAQLATNTLIYTPATNDNGTGYATLDFQVRDDGGTPNGGQDTDQSANTLTFDVTSINDEPAGTDDTLTIDEGGSLILTAAHFGFTDPIDGDALASVEITGVPSPGALMFAGAAITGVGPHTFTAAQLATNTLIYTPATNDNGAGYATLDFQVRDDGGTPNGGQDTDQSANTLTFDVTSINDEPAGTDDTLTIDEGGSLILTAAHFGFTDPIDGDALASVEITGVPSPGALTFAGAAITGVGPHTFTAAQLATNTLIYTPATNDNGTGYATLDFQVRDDGGTPNGGQDTDQSANTLTFDVTSINDEPAGTDDTLTIDEGGSLILNAAHFGFTDPLDGDALASVQITGVPSQGVLTFAGAAITGVGPHTFTAAQLATNTLIYTPATNDNGTGYATLDFLVRDDGGTPNGGIDTDATENRLTFDVTSINDEPAGSDDTLTIDEDGSLILTAAHFGFTDPLDRDGLHSVVISALPSAGELTFAGAAITGVGPHTFSVAQLATNTLVYTPAANDNGTNYATLDFQVRDDGGTPNGGIDTDASPNRLTFDITPINDEPEGTDNTLVISEGSELVLTANHFGFSDKIEGDGLQEVVITALPAMGELSFAGSAITGVGPHTLTVAQLATNTLIYTPATNDNGADYASLDFQVRDDGGTLNGGVDTDASANRLTFDVTSINDEPAGTDDTLTIDEDSSLILTAAHFGFSDPLDFDGLEAVVITTLPAVGELSFAGSAITGGGPHTFTAAQLATNTLIYTPAANDNGTGYATLDFLVRDDGSTLNGGIDTDASANRLTFDVTSINDEPTGTDDSLTIDEGGSLILTVEHFGFSDELEGDGLQEIVITALPVMGDLSFAGSAITGVGPHTFTVAQLATNALIYTPATNDHGTNYATLDFQVRDDGGILNGGIDTDASPNRLTFDITSINDEPAGTDDTLTIDEDGSLILTAAHFGFSDTLDGDELASVQITGAPSPGALTFAGAAITGIGPHSFTVAQLSSNTLIYTPEAESHGTAYATLNFRVVDDGGTLDGGVNTDQSPNTLTFDVNPVNDRPTSVSLTGLALNENEPGATIGVVTVVDPDANDIHTVTVDDPRFKVIAGQLQLVPGASVDYETEPEIPLTLSAVDPGGLVQQNSIVLQVQNVNEAPILRNELEAQSGQLPFGFTLPANTFTDVDGDDLNYSVTLADGQPLPEGISFNPLTLDFVVDPVVIVVSSLDIQISVSDGLGKSATTIMTITLEPELAEAVSAQPSQPDFPEQETVVVDMSPEPKQAEVIETTATQTALLEELQIDTLKEEPIERLEITPLTTQERLQADEEPVAERARPTQTESDETVVLLDGDDTTPLSQLFDVRDDDIIDSFAKLAKLMDRQLDMNSQDSERVRRIVGTSVTITSSLSVGYVLWLVRGGALIGSLMSTLPAWRFIDPLPILDSLADGDDDDDESLESMVDTPEETQPSDQNDQSGDQLTHDDHASRQ